MAFVIRLVENFISEKAKIGDNVKIWHFAYVGENTEIGDNVKIGSLAHVDYDVKDTGEVTVAAPDEESRKKAMNMIKDIIAKPEMNKIYKGKVIKIMDFGAFVNFLGKQDGLVHISELAAKRVAKVTDVVKEGDEVSVMEMVKLDKVARMQKIS